MLPCSALPFFKTVSSSNWPQYFYVVEYDLELDPPAFTSQKQGLWCTPLTWFIQCYVTNLGPDSCQASTLLSLIPIFFLAIQMQLTLFIFFGGKTETRAWNLLSVPCQPSALDASLASSVSKARALQECTTSGNFSEYKQVIPRQNKKLLQIH